MHWKNFCVLSLVTTKMWTEVKIALFSNERHFKNIFQIKKKRTFFRRNLLKLQSKDTILHVTITFFLKQRAILRLNWQVARVDSRERTMSKKAKQRKKAQTEILQILFMKYLLATILRQYRRRNINRMSYSHEWPLRSRVQ